jgi:hypothetical protein
LTTSVPASGSKTSRGRTVSTSRPSTCR